MGMLLFSEKQWHLIVSTENDRDLEILTACFKTIQWLFTIRYHDKIRN